MFDFTIRYDKEAIAPEGLEYTGELCKLIEDIHEQKQRKSIKILDIWNNRRANNILQIQSKCRQGYSSEGIINLDMLLYVLNDIDLYKLLELLRLSNGDEDFAASLIKPFLTQLIKMGVFYATKYIKGKGISKADVTIKNFSITKGDKNEIIICLSLYEETTSVEYWLYYPAYVLTALKAAADPENVIPPVTPIDNYSPVYDANIIQPNPIIKNQTLQLINSWLKKDYNENTSDDLPTIDVYIDKRNINTIVEAREINRCRPSMGKSDSLCYRIEILDVVKEIRNYISKYIYIEPSSDCKWDDILLRVNAIFAIDDYGITKPHIQLLENILAIFYSKLKYKIMEKIAGEVDQDIPSCFVSDSYKIDLEIIKNVDTKEKKIYMSMNISFGPMRALSPDDVRARLAISASELNDERLKRNIMNLDADTIDFIYISIMGYALKSIEDEEDEEGEEDE